MNEIEIYEDVLNHWIEIKEALEQGGQKDTALGTVGRISYLSNGCVFCQRFSKDGCKECPYKLLTGKYCFSNEGHWLEFVEGDTPNEDLVNAIALISWLEHNRTYIIDALKTRRVSAASYKTLHEAMLSIENLYPDVTYIHPNDKMTYAYSDGKLVAIIRRWSYVLVTWLEERE